MAKELKTFSLDEVRKELKTINQFGGVISSTDFTKTLEYIGTGNYHLNALFSGDLFKGIPCNKGVAIVGESGCVQKNQRIKIYKIKSNPNAKHKIINM
jgi:hypothetical protein